METNTMKLILTILIVFLVVVSKAQTVAIVNDPDGYANVRKDGNNKAAVVGQLKSGTIIIIDDENKSDWKPFYFEGANEKAFDNSNINGNHSFSPAYIHKSRIIKLNSLPKMVYKKDVGFVSLKSVDGVIDTLVLSIKTKPFLPNMHTIQRSQGFVTKIDKKKPWGIDGGLPRKEIYDVFLTINGKQVPMSKESYNDLFEPGNNFDIHYDKMGNIYIHMLNSDGAGYYDLIWVINNGKLIKRYTDNSNA